MTQTERPDALTALDMLQLYPASIVERLVEDDAFRNGIGVRDGLLVLIGSAGRFARRAFYEEIRRVHGGGGPREVADVDGVIWKLEQVQRGGRTALRLSRDGLVEHLLPHLVLHPDSATRLAELDRSLADAGYSTEDLPDWRSTLSDRPLDDDEVRRFHDVLERTPTAFARRVEASLASGSGHATTIVPDRREHYESLIGIGIAANVAALAKDVVRPHVHRLLSGSDQAGPRMALLASAHSSLLAGSAVERLAEAEVVDLIAWAHEEGDIMSRVAAVEIALAASSRMPLPEPELRRLIESVLAQDPADPGGRLSLLSATVALAASELSRTRVLEDMPPFQRRAVIFAHASFFERTVFGRVDVKPMADWARGHGLRRFYLQTMVERRLEPRWSAELASPEQLKAEFVSRISLAAGLHRAHIASGELGDFLFGDGDDGLARHARFPQSFLPGPLEGMVGEGGAVPLPPHFEQLLDEAMSGDDLQPASVIALINLRSVFALDAARVDRAVTLIRAAGHRFDASVDDETRLLLYNGLAALAAETRNVALADELRMMVRKEQSGSSIHDEFLLALTAASAHAEPNEWSHYLGAWCADLAFRAQGGAARHLLEDLELLCLIEPGLRHALGSGKAALASALAV